MNNTMKELYKHPKWQKKRLKILSRDRWKCSKCGDKESQLHVHHKKYINGRKPWEYKNKDLVTLCEKCHAALHEEKNKKTEYIIPVEKANRKLSSQQAKVEIPSWQVLERLITQAEQKGYPCFLADDNGGCNIESKNDLIGIFKNAKGKIWDKKYWIKEYDDKKEIIDNVKMKITKNDMESLKTENGGYTAKTIKKLIGKYPPGKGWVKSLIGKEITKLEYDKLFCC